MKRLVLIFSFLAVAFVSGCNKQEPKPAALPPAKVEPAKSAASPAPPKIDGPSVDEILQKVQGAYAAITNYTSTGKIVSHVDMAGTDFSKLGMSKELTDSPGLKQAMAMSRNQAILTDFTIKIARPDRYVIEWELKAAATPGESMKGAAWSEGTNHFVMMNTNQYSQLPDQRMAFALSGGVAETVPKFFFEGSFGLLRFKNLLQHVRLPDEKLGDDDCYIVEGSHVGIGRERYWIRKADHLVCQIQQVYRDNTDKSPAKTGAAIREQLKAMNVEATSELLANPELRKLTESLMAMEAGIKGTNTETHTGILVNQPLKSADLSFQPPSTAKLVPSPIIERLKNKKGK